MVSEAGDRTDQTDSTKVKTSIRSTGTIPPGGSKESYGQFLHVFFTFGVGDTLEVKKNEGHFSFAVEAEYASVIRYAEKLGIENGFVQEKEAAEESFIPPFTYEGV